MLIVKLDLQSAGSSPNLSYTKSSARDAIRIRGQKKPSGGWEYLINPPLPNSDRHSGDKIPFPFLVNLLLGLLTYLSQVQLFHSPFVVL